MGFTYTYTSINTVLTGMYGKQTLLVMLLCRPPTKGVGGHIVFGTDPIGVGSGVGIKLLVCSVS